MMKLCFVICMLLSISCAPTAGRVNERYSESSGAQRVASSEHKNPGEVVEEFMQFVSDDDGENARKLFAPPKPLKPASSTPRPGDVGVEAPPERLDWVAIFQERDFNFRKIVSEKVEGENAIVLADLGAAGLDKFSQRAEFRLERSNQQWLIRDIELIVK